MIHTPLPVLTSGCRNPLSGKHLLQHREGRTERPKRHRGRNPLSGKHLLQHVPSNINELAFKPRRNPLSGKHLLQLDVEITTFRTETYEGRNPLSGKHLLQPLYGAIQGLPDPQESQSPFGEASLATTHLDGG